MKPRIDTELLFTAALSLFVIALLIAAFDLPVLLRYAPFIAGGLTLFFLVVLLAGRFDARILSWTETALKDIWGGGADSRIEEAEEIPSPWPAVLRVIAYAVGFLLAVYWFGFFLTTPIFILTYLTLDAGARPLSALVASAALSALILVTLTQLNVDLWIGRIPELVPGYLGGAVEPQF